MKKINELHIGKIQTITVYKNITFREKEIYRTELYAKMIQVKLIVFFLTVMKDILKKFYH